MSHHSKRYDSDVIEAGQPFPDFTLQDQDGNTVRLEDLRGSKVAIFFYPKDDTPGCTTEACEFRDALVQDPNVRIIGVSPDSVASHRKFANKYGLNFTLLSDPDQALSRAVGVWGEKSMYGKKYMGVFRTTFLLDAGGKVERVFEQVKPQGHAAQVMPHLK